VSSVTEVLFIGGRSGVGKTSVGAEIHAQLSAAGVQHCLIEGDNLDQAYPIPWQRGLKLAEQNLGAMWRNYRRAGYTRLVYTNTASVTVVAELVEAMGDGPRTTAALLTATDSTARRRLSAREIGSALERHLDRSKVAARRLEQDAPAWVTRVVTDGRSVPEIASELIRLTGWSHEEAEP
jgi:hypothetical protein